MWRLTRYFNERLGITVDGRGYYGTAYVGLNSTSVTRPAISHVRFPGGSNLPLLHAAEVFGCGARDGRICDCAISRATPTDLGPNLWGCIRME